MTSVSVSSSAASSASADTFAREGLSVLGIHVFFDDPRPGLIVGTDLPSIVVHQPAPGLEGDRGLFLQIHLGDLGIIPAERPYNVCLLQPDLRFLFLGDIHKADRRVLAVGAAVHLKAQPAHPHFRKFPDHKRIADLLPEPFPHGLKPACLKELFLIVLMDKGADIVVELLPAVVLTVPFVNKALPVEHRIAAGGEIHIIGRHKHMAESVEEANRAFDLLLHVFIFHACPVACHAEIPPGKLAENRLHEPVVEGIVKLNGGVIRAARDGAVGAWGVPVHDRAVAHIAHPDPGIAVRHRLVKFHETEIPVYNINTVFIIDLHLPTSQPFRQREKRLPSGFPNRPAASAWHTFRDTSSLYSFSAAMSILLSINEQILPDFRWQRGIFPLSYHKKALRIEIKNDIIKQDLKNGAPALALQTDPVLQHKRGRRRKRSAPGKARTNGKDKKK